MQKVHAVASHWHGDFDEPALRKWAEKLRSQLDAPRVSLGLVFMSPRFASSAAAALEVLRVHGQIPLLLGCSSTALIAGGQEMEREPGLVLALYDLPGAQLHALHFTPGDAELGRETGHWHSQTGLSADAVNGWLAFADPFQMDADAWLKSWNRAYPGIPVLGGLASGDPAEQQTQVYLNGEVFDSGGVALGVSGKVKLASVISQGCTPIGETWTITKVEQNIIHTIGNRPAYQVLLETFNQLPAEEQNNARGNLFVGLVMNEYLEEFHRGDFLIRNLIGADPKSGCIAVGALPRPGQTIQFQKRDARAATEDMRALLERAKGELAGATVYGGCLCSCNGRGTRLFGAPNHDASLVEDYLGPLGLAGFFCNGEIGPVGNRNYLHGYTASLALFRSK